MFSFRTQWILFALFLVNCNTDPMAKMPDFRIAMAKNQQVIRTGNIPEGQPTMLIHFHSDCRDCQEEAEAIIQHINELKEVRIYFVSIQDTAHINLFHDYYKFGKYPNIQVGQDVDTTMIKHFQTGTTPLLALYDNKKKIKAVFEGKANIDKLLELVAEI